ncbi:uncharacterized protein [Rutidosis leptorrhynchoides]|uniref:uncharacterized protein n=1 Tax=Rutidosis leptorrhynchoides TaxID=125765 RepID=UPI003A999BE7
MRRRSQKDQDFTQPFSDPEKHVHGVYKRREERDLRKNFEVLPFCLIEMDGEEEGNPPPVVNEVVVNDPNDTPMWNVRMVAQTDRLFRGLIDENPFDHIQYFNDICDIYKIKDVTEDAFKLTAFPFTLDGEAKAWLRNLPSDSIRSFQDLNEVFNNHFFPTSKVERLRMEINGFTQRGDESLYDAWVRFKKLLRACQPHGLNKKEYINTLYRGTNFPTKQYLDSSSDGVFMYNSPNAAKNLLEDISVNTYEWAPSPRELTRKNVAQVESEVGQVTLASLNNQFQLYGKELKKLQQTIVAMQVGCQRCEGPYLTKTCPQVNQCNHIDLNDIPMNSDAHVNFVRTFPSNTQVNPSTYNNNRQQNQNQNNNNNTTRVIPIESNNNQNPSYPKRNENVNAITNRSGLTTQGVEEPQPQPFITQEPLPSFIEDKIGVSNEKGKEKVDATGVNANDAKGKDEKGKDNGKEPLKVTRPVPYPNALRKDKLAAQYKKFQEIMKNVSVNLPITDVLKGMPNYGRFIKELISQRGKYHDETSFFIEEECNKILTSRPRIPKKLGDSGKFVFPCKFSESEVFNALADLGASINDVVRALSINLMPHSLYERLGLGPLKPTRIRIRLANHSFDTAIGIAEDILVSIDSLVFPVDFVIMEMKEDLQVPLILGRPFLATADTIILVQRNQLNIGVGEECMTINIREAMRQPSNTDDDECYAIDHIDIYVHDELEKLLKVDTSEFDQTFDNEIVDLEADFRELMNCDLVDETIREDIFESIPHEDRFQIKSSWE